MVGVILAAGRGSRIQPFSSRYPKPILPVCNKPILEHQIAHMVALGIREVIIVVGHLGYEIARVLGDGHQLGVKIQYAEQKEILGIAPCRCRPGIYNFQAVHALPRRHIF